MATTSTTRKKSTSKDVKTTAEQNMVPSVPAPDAKDVGKLADYINHKWNELIRNHEDLFLGMLIDEKVPHKEGAPPILYVSRKENRKKIAEYLTKVRDKAEAKAKDSQKVIHDFDLRTLPKDHLAIAEDDHGLLYLPHPYVVPGGRFNETYGWDSAFIVRGLVLDKQYDIAKHVVDNKIYSIQHYGMILNANRSYYLGRSQAPFLTNKVLDIYRNY
ncbi:MAG: trehalase family glycosidase, partial [Rickettsiales bacterium]